MDPTDVALTDPGLIAPMGLLIGILVASFLVFLTRRLGLGLLVIVWFTLTVAYIPRATLWVISSQWFSEFGTTPLLAAVFVFVAGMIYREITLIGWVIVTGLPSMLRSAVFNVRRLIWRYRAMTAAERREAGVVAWMIAGTLFSVFAGLVTVWLGAPTSVTLAAMCGALIGWFLLSRIARRLAIVTRR